MKRFRVTFPNKRYVIAAIVISLVVSVLIHFPELLALTYSGSESLELYHGLHAEGVINEMVFSFFSLLLLFSINTYTFRFHHSSTRIGWKQVLGSFFLMWLLSGIFGKTFFFLHQTYDIPAIDVMMHHYAHPVRDLIMATLTTGGCYIIYLIDRQQQVTLQYQQLQAENILNQYEVLKNQLNPHMLFNSLNTLRSLVRENQDKAQEYIQQLSKVLRYTLQDTDSNCVTLREEREFVAAYTFLLKMRFEDNLLFDVQLHDAFDHLYLPPMSVQVLIENAVKHNEISSRRPLTITIATDEEHGLSVSNPIQHKRTATAGTGIGLANLVKRYQLLFGRDITITENDAFTVRIPLISDPYERSKNR